FSSPKGRVFFNEEGAQYNSDINSNKGILVITAENAGLKITRSFSGVINADFAKMKAIEGFFQDYPYGCIQINTYEEDAGFDADISLYSDRDCHSDFHIKSFHFVSVDIVPSGDIEQTSLEEEAPPQPAETPAEEENARRKAEILSYNVHECLKDMNLVDYRFDDFAEYYNGGYYYKTQELNYNDPELNTGRRMVVHTIKIDLNKVDIFVTPKVRDTITTSDFSTKGLSLWDQPWRKFSYDDYQMDIAINGGGWTEEKSGGQVTGYDIHGPYVSEGQVHSRKEGYALVVYDGKLVHDRPLVDIFNVKDTYFNYIEYAVAAFNPLVEKTYRGPYFTEKVDKFNGDQTYARANTRARTSIGIDTDNYVLIIIVEDVKYVSNSEIKDGANLKEIACLHLAHGANKAINMDGGDSTALILEGEVKVPTVTTQHQVKNHLGIKIKPEYDIR
ncbi:MAG: phosphodiester glycosidase family protein, partial [Nanoarchaeota archaeon]|nr:phosphodiester glycosidase family protein [Nanoarchaeota archaeon]